MGAFDLFEGVYGSEKFSTKDDMMRKLAPNAQSARKWAALQQDLIREAEHAKAVNIDPQSLLLSLFLKVNDAA